MSRTIKASPDPRGQKGGRVTEQNARSKCRQIAARCQREASSKHRNITRSKPRRSKQETQKHKNGRRKQGLRPSKQDAEPMRKRKERIRKQTARGRKEHEVAWTYFLVRLYGPPAADPLHSSVACSLGVAKALFYAR